MVGVASAALAAPAKPAWPLMVGVASAALAAPAKPAWPLMVGVASAALGAIRARVRRRAEAKGPEQRLVARARDARGDRALERAGVKPAGLGDVRHLEQDGRRLRRRVRD